MTSHRPPRMFPVRALSLLMVAIISYGCDSGTLPVQIEEPPDPDAGLPEDIAEASPDSAVVEDADAYETSWEDVPTDASPDLETPVDSTISELLEVNGDTPDEVLDIVEDSTAQIEVIDPCASPFIYLKDRQFRLGNDPWVPVSVNYIFDVRLFSDGHYQVVPHHAFCSDNLCCRDQETCLAEARAQLSQIKSLGINSIRIVGLEAIPIDGRLVMRCSEQKGPTWLDPCTAEQNLVLAPTNPQALQLIADALALAAEADLRVILLAGHGPLDAPVIRDDYSTYLTNLATRFADSPTIFAYDLANEPVYEMQVKDIDKEDLNAIVRDWYDAVRTGTPRQMVTMGLAEIGSVNTWDPGAMPLDFVSWHIYTGGKWTDKERNYMAIFNAWAGRDPRPALIGETGLTAEGDGFTDAIQQEFARYVLETSWACGLMGLQWWIYRDMTWNEYNQRFGLVRFDGTVRPAATEFAAFTPLLPRPPCPSPAYEGNNPGGHFFTEGRVLDPDGKPLRNAFIRGKMCFTGGADWTISKADGSFVLISEYPINQLKVTAPGLSVETRSILCGILNAGDVRLERLDLDMAISPPSTCP